MGAPIPQQQTALGKYLDKNGRYPQVQLQIQPIDPSRKTIMLSQFEEYSFQNSVIVPVDSFSFTARNPTLPGSLYSFIQDGDIAVLYANGQPVATGLIDSVNIGTDADGGETVKIQGRTLICQLEDQNAVNDVDDPIWGNSMLPADVINALILSTRINFYRLQQAPSSTAMLFATEPGESKLSALTRYLEPLNCLAWMDPDGTVVVGRPDMGSAPLGTFIMDRANRMANCLSMQANYASTQIPNVIVPVWTGQESTQSRIAPEQRIINMAAGPARLFKFKHRVPKAVVVSSPNGADPQSLSQANQLTLAGGANYLQAYAQREIARANVNEIGVQVNIQGHYNSNLQPILADTCYNINYPRASLNEKMYLHTVGYTLTMQGQRTSLNFCRCGSIVAGVTVKSQKAASTKTKVNGGGTK